MHLGLDVGTGLTKLARRPEGDGATGPDGAVRATSTAFSYQGFAGEIPSGPPGEAAASGVSRCDGFPLMLDGVWSATRVSAWQHRAPGEVAQDFLEHVLSSVRRQPDGRDGQDGPFQGLAVAVPAAKPAWVGAGAQAGGSAGTELRDILTTLGYPPQRLVAAPVAALLYLRRKHQDLAAASRVVFCDIGAGSIGLALCLGRGHGVRVADAVQLAGSLAWSGDTLADAEVGDRPPTLAECLVMALAKASGAPVSRGPSAMSVRRWRALEQALADADQRDRLDAVLRHASIARQRYGSAIALRFADLEVTAAHMLDACEPLAERAAAVLSGLLKRQDDPAWLRPGTDAGTRIVLTGGLSALPVLRDALLASAGIDPDAPGGALIAPDHAERIGAAALGAALVAGGQADPGDRYPHGLRLLVHRSVGGRIVSGHLELAAAHSIDMEMAETVFLTEGGEDVLLTVPPGPPEDVPLPVQVVPAGTGVPVHAAFGSLAPPKPGTYRVGVRGGPGGVAVVLQDTDGSAPLAYPLADQQPRRGTGG
jgi:hypothetical protein